jgi:hypothetical protein
LRGQRRPRSSGTAIQLDGDSFGPIIGARLTVLLHGRDGIHG